MEGIKISRKELYYMVWAESMLSLSRKYDISDVGLRKICKRMDIPLPKQGYWQKIQAGRSIPMTKLPKNDSVNQEVTLYLRSDDDGFDGKLQTVNEIQKEIENDPKINVKVPRKISKQDKLIAEVRESLTTNKHRSSYDCLVASSWGELDIKVNPKNIGRALRFMDTLIKALRARGHDIQISNFETYAIVEDEEIKICLREKMRQIPRDENMRWRRYKATNMLALKIGHWGDIERKDGKQTIEEQLPKIIAKLEHLGNKFRRDRIVRQRREEVRLEEERIQQEIVNRKKKELDDFKDLLKRSVRWQKAELLRSYINAVEQKEILNNSVTEDQQVWLAWARGKADWYDPLIEAKDKLLYEIDRDELTIELYAK